MRTFVWATGMILAGLVALYVAGKRAIALVETIDVATLAPAPGAEFIRTRSGRVHVVDVGEGPVVLLIHGSGRSIADWREGVVERLSLRHRVIAFDCYGFGLSERNPKFVYEFVPEDCPVERRWGRPSEPRSPIADCRTALRSLDPHREARSG